MQSKFLRMTKSSPLSYEGILIYFLILKMTIFTVINCFPIHNKNANS